MHGKLGGGKSGAAGGVGSMTRTFVRRGKRHRIVSLSNPDCVDIGFLHHTLDELSGPSQNGATRVGWHRPEPGPQAQRVGRGPALGASPNGFTVTGFAEQVRVMTGRSIVGYSTRHTTIGRRPRRDEPPATTP
jgi:hypothetical protein